MAAPTFVAGGSSFGTIGAATMSIPNTAQAGDLLIAIVHTANQTRTIPAGWTQAPQSPQSTGTAGATGGTGGMRLTVFYKFMVAGEPDVSLSDVGDVQVGACYAFRGVDPYNPFNASAGNIQSTQDTTLEIPGLTTTKDDCLLVLMGSSGTDTNTDQSSAWANASLTSLTHQDDVFTSQGGGGGIMLATGVMATAGVVSTTTATLAGSTNQARIALALNPAPVLDTRPARAFDGVDDFIDVETPNINGAVTFMVIAKWRADNNAASANWQAAMVDHTGSYSPVMPGIERETASDRLWSSGGSGTRTTNQLATVGEWAMWFFGRSAGTTAGRWTKGNPDGTFAHENATGTEADPGNHAGGFLTWGKWGTGDFSNMIVAVAAVWDRNLSDADREAIIADPSLQAIYDTSPVRLYAFNQDPVAGIVDLMGSGKDQLNVTGTAVIQDTYPSFDFTTPSAGGTVATVPPATMTSSAVAPVTTASPFPPAAALTSNAVGPAARATSAPAAITSQGVSPSERASVPVAGTSLAASSPRASAAAPVAVVTSQAAAPAERSAVPAGQIDMIQPPPILPRIDQVPAGELAAVGPSPSHRQSAAPPATLTARSGPRYIELPSGAVGHWRIGEADGDAIDSTGISGPGTYVGSPARAQPSLVPSEPADGSTLFDGSNDRILLPDGDLMSIGADGAFTIGVTVTLDPAMLPNVWAVSASQTAVGASALVGITNGGTAPVAGNIRGFFRTDAASVIQLHATGDYRDGLPHHVILTSDGSTISLFVDGQLADSGPLPAGAITLTRSTIGAIVRDTTSLFWDGGADDVVLLDRGLSSLEVDDWHRRWAGQTVTTIAAGTPPAAQVQAVGVAAAEAVTIQPAALNLTAVPPSAGGEITEPATAGVITLTASSSRSAATVPAATSTRSGSAPASKVTSPAAVRTSAASAPAAKASTVTATATGIGAVAAHRATSPAGRIDSIAPPPAVSGEQNQPTPAAIMNLTAPAGAVSARAAAASQQLATVSSAHRANASAASSTLASSPPHVAARAPASLSSQAGVSPRHTVTGAAAVVTSVAPPPAISGEQTVPVPAATINLTASTPTAKVPVTPPTVTLHALLARHEVAIEQAGTVALAAPTPQVARVQLVPVADATAYGVPSTQYATQAASAGELVLTSAFGGDRVGIAAVAVLNLPTSTPTVGMTVGAQRYGHPAPGTTGGPAVVGTGYGSQPATGGPRPTGTGHRRSTQEGTPWR